MEDGQLEKIIRSYGGILFTSALILGASFTNQQSLQVVLTQQQSLMTQQQALKTQQDNQEKSFITLDNQEKSLITQQQALKTQLDNQEKSLITQQQALKTQLDNQEKGLTTLNLKLDSIGYGFGLTLGIFALSGNLVQVLKYYDDKRASQKKETEQEQNLSKTDNQTHQQEERDLQEKG